MNDDGDLVTLASEEVYQEVVDNMAGSNKAIRLVLVSWYRQSGAITFKDAKNHGASVPKPPSLHADTELGVAADDITSRPLTEGLR